MDDPTLPRRVTTSRGDAANLRIFRGEDGKKAGAGPLLHVGTAAYLAAGAQEVWTVSEEGAVRYFDAQGERKASHYPVTVSLPAPRR